MFMMDDIRRYTKDNNTEFYDIRMILERNSPRIGLATILENPKNSVHQNDEKFLIPIKIEIDDIFPTTKENIPYDKSTEKSSSWIRWLWSRK